MGFLSQFRPPPGHSKLRIAFGYLGAAIFVLIASLVVNSTEGSPFREEVLFVSAIFGLLPLAVITVVKAAMKRKIWRVLFAILLVLSVPLPVKIYQHNVALRDAFGVTCPPAMTTGDTVALSASPDRKELRWSEWDVVGGGGVLGRTAEDARAGFEVFPSARVTLGPHYELGLRYPTPLPVHTLYFRSTVAGTVQIKVTGHVIGGEDYLGTFYVPVIKTCQIVVADQ